MRAGKPGCGPGSKAASSFPKVIAAALPRLIKAVVISVEGIEKLGKVSHQLTYRLVNFRILVCARPAASKGV